MPVDADELQRDPGLVVHVELQQHGGEGLDRRRQAQLAGVERSHVGDLGDDLARAVRGFDVIRADQDIGLDRVVEVAELLGGHVVERRGQQAVGHGRLHGRRHRTAWRYQRHELLADPGEGIGHGDDDLALELVGHRQSGHHGAVPRRGQDDDLGVGGGVVVAGTDLELAVRPLLEELVDLLEGPVTGA
jgi:hypothetical protein